MPTPQTEPQNVAQRLIDEAQMEDLKKAASRLADEASEIIRKHPLSSVAGALVVGFALGSWINRGR